VRIELGWKRDQFSIGAQRMRFCFAIVAMAALSFGLGCSPGPHLPDYQSPKLAKSQAATLNGYSGTYITAVDGQGIPGSGVQMANLGGNDVTLAPGKHTLTLTLATGNMFVRQKTWSTTYSFEAGHEYDVGPYSAEMFHVRHVTLRDKTSGKLMRID
jgi:hypothetical protein